MNLEIKKHEIESRFGDLTESQRQFIFAPERFSCVAGGYASGKSFSICMKSLLLAATIPGNVGMILRYRGSDLEESTMQVFFQDVCPPSWIKQYYKKTRTVILRNGSQILFRHLHDANAAAKTRRVGANLGFYGVDQAEEIGIEHWDAMTSRLRLPLAPKKFGFLAINPNGHDWIWERWFKQFQPWPKDEAGGRLPIDGKYYQTFYPQPNYFGIAVNSEEQRTSNGGFIEDSYFDAQIASMAEDVRDRYVYCSFDDFHGKLYKDFDAGLQDESFASVHNVQPFHPPANWHCIVGIDIGGDSPWAVVPHWVDEAGNLVVSSGFHNRTSNVGDVVRWIKHNLPWNESRTTFIIDPENKTAIYDLAVLGIHCSTAHKDCLPNILRVSGYMHVEAKRKLPDWYEGTQPRDRWLRFRDKGSPRIFAMTDAKVWRKEHDRAKWDPAKPDHMWKSSVERFDSVEATQYVVASRPEASKLLEAEKSYSHLAKLDPLSYREWNQMHKRIAEINYKLGGGGALREMDAEARRTLNGKPPEFSGKREW